MLILKPCEREIVDWYRREGRRSLEDRWRAEDAERLAAGLEPLDWPTFDDADLRACERSCSECGTTLRYASVSARNVAETEGRLCASCGSARRWRKPKEEQ